MWQRLLQAGADPSVQDNRGRTADYYLDQANELRMPTSEKHPAESRGRPMDGECQVMQSRSSAQ